MVNETQSKGASASAAGSGSGAVGSGGGGFRAKMNHYLHSGDKKHVFGGILIVGAIFAVPWYYINRGSKHQSHQDYMEKADRARNERLSGGASPGKQSTAS